MILIGIFAQRSCRGRLETAEKEKGDGFLSQSDTEPSETSEKVPNPQNF